MPLARGKANLGLQWRTILPPLAGPVAALLLQAAPCALSQAAPVCRIASLQLRFHNQPVDLTPSFDPDRHQYKATLDTSMDSFSVDAAPLGSAQLVGVPVNAVPIEGGHKHELTVHTTGRYCEQISYTVEVKRLDGSQTELKALRVEDGVLQPPFWPGVRKYQVVLNMQQDLIRLMYVLVDSQQKIRCTAGPQELPKSAEAHSSDGNNHQSVPPGDSLMVSSRGSERAFTGTGEVQRMEHQQIFPIDVGHRRTLTITVETANPVLANVGVYVVEVTRADCDLAKPFFNTLSSSCVNNCPEGHYQNHAAKRCSACGANCAICKGPLRCELCREDTLHRAYRLLPDGKCFELVSSFEEKYYWWCVSAGIFAALLVCLCFVQLCVCLCDRDQYEAPVRKDSLPGGGTDSDLETSRMLS
mmetsp:Transcript_76209/g.150728  ORF Transcript_76209/g.150728 Transcript_76209/m.150728 type:complete len:415 (-) Transcript_76209:3-1247(-)